MAEVLKAEVKADLVAEAVLEAKNVVSLFAQELGTAVPVSSVKLDRQVKALRRGEQVAIGVGIPVKPQALVSPQLGDKKLPVKSLGALDKLFRS